MYHLLSIFTFYFLLITFILLSNANASSYRPPPSFILRRGGALPSTPSPSQSPIPSTLDTIAPNSTTIPTAAAAAATTTIQPRYTSRITKGLTTAVAPLLTPYASASATSNITNPNTNTSATATAKNNNTEAFTFKGLKDSLGPAYNTFAVGVLERFKVVREVVSKQLASFNDDDDDVKDVEVSVNAAANVTSLSSNYNATIDVDIDELTNTVKEDIVTRYYVKPKRSTRKFFSRYTGKSGAFSGKQRIQPSSIPQSSSSSSFESSTTTDIPTQKSTQNAKRLTLELLALKNTKKLQSIDFEIRTRQDKIRQLQLEKDTLQNRPNPLLKSNFISDSMVDLYIKSLCKSGRLVLLNHTELWSDHNIDLSLTSDDDYIDDSFPTSRASQIEKNTGSWLLRQTLGRDKSIGERIGETLESTAYGVTCKAVMNAVVSGISGLHGINVLEVGEVRLYTVPSPSNSNNSNNGGGSGSSSSLKAAAEKALQAGIKKNLKANNSSRKKKSKSRSPSPPPLSHAFIQREAVTETLLSHCQISMPLLKLFPNTLQRALLSNVITVVTSTLTDGIKGFRLRILGHQLTLNFEPMNENDALAWVNNNLRYLPKVTRKTEEFENAVRTIAQTIHTELKFLDKWHERILGSGILRMQLANLIARLVLTLVDEALGGLKFDLWQEGGGARVLGGVEYRHGE